MSRIGRAPIAIPAGVKVTLEEGNVIIVEGPKGTLTRKLNPELTINVEGAEVLVTRPDDDKFTRSIHGLNRTLIANMVQGVAEGYKKTLEINGVGYRAIKDGSKLVMTLGFSHQVIVPEVDGITVDVPNANTVIITGIDKELVGQFAADVRSKRPPEPYKGKGIKYADEVIRRKEGKTGAK